MTSESRMQPPQQVKKIYEFHAVHEGGDEGYIAVENYGNSVYMVRPQMRNYQKGLTGGHDTLSGPGLAEAVSYMRGAGIDVTPQHIFEVMKAGKLDSALIIGAPMLPPKP